MVQRSNTVQDKQDNTTVFGGFVARKNGRREKEGKVDNTLAKITEEMM